jgi:hypothetical protein
MSKSRELLSCGETSRKCALVVLILKCTNLTPLQPPFKTVAQKLEKSKISGFYPHTGGDPH